MDGESIYESSESWLGRCCCELGYDVTAVDDLNDPTHTKNYKKQVEEFISAHHIDFNVCSITDFKTEKHCDAVLLIDVLEHLSNPRDILNVSVQCLKQNGLARALPHSQ